MDIAKLTKDVEKSAGGRLSSFRSPANEKASGVSSISFFMALITPLILIAGTIYCCILGWEPPEWYKIMRLSILVALAASIISFIFGVTALSMIKREEPQSKTEVLAKIGLYASFGCLVLIVTLLFIAAHTIKLVTL